MSNRRYSLPSLHRARKFSFGLKKKSLGDDDNFFSNGSPGSSHRSSSSSGGHATNSGQHQSGHHGSSSVTGSSTALNMLNSSETRIVQLKRMMSSIHPGHCRLLPGHDRLYHIFGHRRVDRFSSKIDVDEVYPNLFIGNEGSARNKSYLKLIGISHVINCAEGVHFCQTNTGSYYYQDIGIKYMGLNILDVPEAKISIHFHETADFIERALSMGSRVLVHCMVGLSRSATIVIAYLIIKRGLSLEEAIRTVRKFREIRPNDGFLRQLIELEYRISTSGNVSCYNNTSIGSGRSGNSMSSASSSVPGEKYNSLESSSSASSSHKYNMKSQFNDEAAGLYRRSSSPVTANFFPSNMAPMSLYSSSFHY